MSWYRNLPHRELGRIVGAVPGATLVVVAAIHGNEPAGLEAMRRVLTQLTPGQLRGEVVAFVGNHAAVKQGVRYQTSDLNRAWRREQISEIRERADLEHELAELRELHDELEAAEARSRGPMHLADLHTSSAPGVPFMMLANDEPHRAFVQHFGVPAMMGLDAHIAGVLSNYVSTRGWIAFSMEGGQHESPASVDALEAAVWQSLHAAGQLVGGAHADRVQAARSELDRMRGDLPRVLEVSGRHAIVEEDHFVMEPGFRNIHRAQRGQLLARDARGEIRAEEDGLVILPLYQGLGNDGFFWGRELPR
ncbi:MAG: succinylglutamate desuccinylase/aspartoacylase family protein [Polyangia bacterium]